MEIEMTAKTAHGTAVVTGASSGIGAVYAERLADRGHDLVLVARRRAELEALASRIVARTGRKVDVLTADLAKAEGQALVEKRLRDDTSITVLVNNAGMAATGPIVGGDADATEAMLAINVLALTRLSAAAANAFAARRTGTVINISSAMSKIIMGRAAGYSASKAYVLNFSRGLAEEVGSYGVHVQAVLPGYTRTPFLSDALLATIPPEAIMPVDELVDAALAGLDRGETITIPSLPNVADWDAYEAARLKLTQNLSRDRPAERYRTPQAA
jgi:short-subunit dehydrogenase